jgi:hypothetical protein
VEFTEVSKTRAKQVHEIAPFTGHNIQKTAGLGASVPGAKIFCNSGVYLYPSDLISWYYLAYH